MSVFDAISVSEDVLKRKISFLEFVETLEEKLISPDVSHREEAVKQLTDVLLLLPLDFLSDLEVSTLLRFFSARLADSVLLTSSCLQSLYFLSKCENFPNNGENSVLTSLFKEHMVQALTQQDRFLVFSLIKHYLGIRLEGLKAFDTEFILGFIQAADGEKDPRNLIIIFDCFAKIASEFSLGPFAEDMFELVACYFPVDFKPAVDDPYSITSSQLVVGLERCLTCNSNFAKFCYQLIQEKFDENKPEEKISILQLLSTALVSFPPAITAEFSNALWQEIRKIAITSRSQSGAEILSLECLKNLIISLTKCGSNDGRNSTLVSLIGQIFKDCEHFLSNVEMQLLDIGNKMATTIARADTSVCQRIATNMLPLLMEQYQTKKTNKIEYANFLTEWISILNEMNKKEPILSVQKSLATLLCDEILHDNQLALTSLGLKMASNLIEIDDHFLANDRLVTIFHLCVRFVDDKSIEIDLRRNAVSFLQILCKNRRDLIKNCLENDKKIDSLNVYAILIVDDSSAEQFLPELLKFTSMEAKHFDALRLFVEENQKNSSVLDVSWRQISQKLVDSAQILINNALENGFNEIFIDLTRIGDVAQDLMVHLNSRSESEMLEFFIEHLQKAETCDTLWVVVCEKLISAMSESNVEKVTPFVDSACHFVENFVNRNPFDPNQSLADCWARSLSSLMNKLPQSSSFLKNLTENYLGGLETKISSNLSALNFFGYSTKALLLRNFTSLCSKCFAKLVSLLNSDSSESTEKVLELIFVEDRRFLSPKTKAKCTFLYKQRIFTEFVSLLTKNFFQADKSEWKKNYFRILSVLLSNTPKEIQTSNEIEKLVPLLVNSIQSDDLEILSPSVSSVETLLNTDSAVSKLHPHIHSLTQRLCKLAEMKQKMEIQSTSLRCLSKIADKVPPSILSPWRQQILKSLANCLDDPKRLVRREAVDCRNKWFLIS